MIFSQRKTIGVFLTKTFEFFDNAVFLALERESKRLNLDVVVFTTAGYFLTQSDYDVQEKNIFRFAAVERLDGIIIVPESYEQGEFRDLLYDMLRRHARCPIVAIRHEGDEYDYVSTNEGQAIRPLVRHLIEDHGLTRICFQKGFPGHTEVDAQADAYRQEMTAHGLPVPEEWICPGNMWSNCGEEAYTAFFSDPENPPQAVVCGNDYMAVGLMRVLAQKGIRVPEDVIVTGFDNIPRYGLDVPSVTTVQPDYDGMVTEAMALMERRIRAGEKSPEQARVTVPGKLILGESCGCGRRPADYFQKVSQYATAQLELRNDRDATMSNMSIDLGACDDLAELHSVMLSKRVEVRRLRDHYLCLFGEPGALMQEAGDKACLVHAMRDHQDWGMPMVTFDRSRLLPPMAERRHEPQMFFIKLLHQKGHNFGYSICQYEAGKVPSSSYVQTNALLSIALENIYRREEIMKLYEERRLSSITDLMTGLMNRRGLMERVQPLWNDLLGHKVAFLCVDMDRLKQINDTWGHAAGDFAIRMVGRAIQQVLPPEAVGARIGGDEFVIFLPNTSEEAAQAMLCAFEDALRQLSQEENRSFTVTASVGFVVKKLNEMDTIEHCIQLSDREMYRTKEAHHAGQV